MRFIVQSDPRRSLEYVMANYPRVKKFKNQSQSRRFQMKGQTGATQIPANPTPPALMAGVIFRSEPFGCAQDRLREESAWD
jgi:hypothetical protein